MEETAPMPLGTTKRQLIRFDPTVSTGTLIQLLVIASGAVFAYGAYQADKTADRLEIAQVKRDVEANRANVNTAVTDMRGDVKDIQRTLGGMNESLAVLKARGAEADNRPRRQ